MLPLNPFIYAGFKIAILPKGLLESRQRELRKAIL